MTVSSMLDSAGRRRSPATLPGFHAGRAPRNKGMLYPADPPTVEEIVCVMRHASEDPHGWRLRAMIVMLWRGGLRVQEALALSEHDLDPQRGSVLVRHGKGGRRREVGMDGWGWENLRPWLSERLELPAGPLFCVIDGPTRGRPWSAAAIRTEFRRHATEAGVRRRFAPHQLRHAHAVELAREGVSLNVIQRQLGHSNLGTTSIYLQGIDIEEIISTVHARRAPHDVGDSGPTALKNPTPMREHRSSVLALGATGLPLSPRKRASEEASASCCAGSSKSMFAWKLATRNRRWPPSGPP
jgi:hypothetical protein